MKSCSRGAPLGLGERSIAQLWIPELTGRIHVPDLHVVSDGIEHEIPTLGFAYGGPHDSRPHGVLGVADASQTTHEIESILLHIPQVRGRGWLTGERIAARPEPFDELHQACTEVFG